MQVRIRHINQGPSIPFTEIHFLELDRLIGTMEKASGFYMPGLGQEPFHSFQFVIEDGEAFAEILIGKGED